MAQLLFWWIFFQHCERSRALLYFFFFGFAGEPFLELIPKTAQDTKRIYRDPQTGKCIFINVMLFTKYGLEGSA